MIVPALMGGLGNTLFQIAAAIGQADRIANEWRIPSSWQYKDYFNIPEEKYIDSYELPRYKEPHFHYSEIPDVQDAELFGYFQSKRYWAHCEEKVKRYLSWSKVPPADLYNPENVKDRCAIHVRGQDYKELSDYHFNLPKEYYEKAIEQSGFKEFTVFTDDEEHAKNLLPDIPRIVGNRNDNARTIEDLFDMANFGGLIMANSSYSWWAAELGRKKKVFAPPQWFGVKKSDYILTDLYCDNWEVVKYDF